MTRVVDSKKKAAGLLTPARTGTEFKPLEVSPQMRAAYERCQSPRQVHRLSSSTVPLLVEQARSAAGAQGIEAPRSMEAPVTPASSDPQQ